MNKKSKKENWELKKQIIKELKSLDNDLDDYKKNLAVYQSIPKNTEVGDDYKKTLKILEEIAGKLEELPKKLKN